MNGREDDFVGRRVLCGREVVKKYCSGEESILWNVEALYAEK